MVRVRWLPNPVWISKDLEPNMDDREVQYNQMEFKNQRPCEMCSYHGLARRPDEGKDKTCIEFQAGNMALYGELEPYPCKCVPTCY